MSATKRVDVQKRIARIFFTGVVSCFLIGHSSVALSQSVQLTPEQQRMLDQLPASQRQQALAALRQAQQNGSGGGEQNSTLVEDLSQGGLAPDNNEAPGNAGSGEVRTAAGSRVVIGFNLQEELSQAEVESVLENPALRRLEGSRYYELDASGVLSIPGLPGIPLLGLTSRQIELRLGAEPALRQFVVSASILESGEPGLAGLEPFGYTVFESSDYAFEPVTSGPVPPDYILGPGDSVVVQFFGNINAIYEFEVSRDGVLNLPELGPVTVAGLPFTEFRQDLNRRVQEMLIGTQISVTMGQLRTIRVFVLGDANRPGSYVVNSLATISSALYVSGGISPIGSLRDIQLKRNGQVVGRLDLYDLLLNGDTSGDGRLQPGDVVFIPPIGAQVSIGGAVKRPAIYETKGSTSVEDVVALAGGFLADAFPSGARIGRIDANRERIVVSIDAEGSESGSVEARAGDELFIPNVLPELEDTVTLAGHVYRPGPYQWRNGMRLADLIRSEMALKPGADSGYVLIRREDPNNRRVHALSVSLAVALAEPGSSENIVLRPRDTVHVFDLAFGRQQVIEPILEELKLQSRFGEPYREVSVSGKVQAPGTYPLEPGMRISDLLHAGGSLAEEAYSLAAELVRYEIVDGQYRSTEVIEVDLDGVLREVESADFVLAEHDNLRISGLPEWDSLWTVRLEGEVTFAGDYRIRRGETLSQVVARAGGLTDAAFPEGAVFLRESLRLREQEQIEVLARRLEADLTAMSLETLDTGGEAMATGRELLTQLRNTDAVGRLVIDLERIAAERSAKSLAGDLELRDGDRLLVPKQAQEVTVIGETQQNTSHLYRAELTRDEYIGMSGGLTRRADKKLIYVVRASGAVVAGSRSRWFGRGSGSEIRPGDTIVVPLETNRVRPLTFWTSVTQILYQAAIAVAAVDSFGN